MNFLPLRGKVTKEWDRVRLELKQKFDRLGVRHCEGNFRKCTPTMFLGFAHVLKRRHLGKWESAERSYNIRDVALLCNTCHDSLERMGERVGGLEVLRLINCRTGGLDLFLDLKHEE